MTVMVNIWLQRMVAVILMAVVISKGLWTAQLRVEDRKGANGLLTSWCGVAGWPWSVCSLLDACLFDFTVSIL
jgi:hypothetical protein